MTGGGRADLAALPAISSRRSTRRSMGKSKKKAAKQPPRIKGPIRATDEAVEFWISPPHTWPVPELLDYIAKAEAGGAVAWERHDATGIHTVYRPLTRPPDRP